MPRTAAAEPRSVRFGVRAVGRTDVGRQRETNEDAMFLDERLGLFVVCDGMGGHASGQLASDLALRTIVETMRTGGATAREGDEPLASAMRAANHAVFEHARRVPACHGMGTTAVGLRVDGDVLHACHCGDSRVYLLRAGRLEQMTRDHSLANLYQDKPELRDRMGPATSNVIVRAIGLDTQVEIDHRVLAMEDGDVYLLCCDGLTDLVTDGMIRDIMTAGESLEAVSESLIRAANDNGGSDNITVILIAVYSEAMLEPDGQLEFPGTRPGF